VIFLHHVRLSAFLLQRRREREANRSRKMHYLNSASRWRFDHFTLEAALAWGRHQNSDRYQSIKPITFLAERPNQPRHDSLQTSFSFHRHDGYHGATT
jgi:hypothetical protein